MFLCDWALRCNAMDIMCKFFKKNICCSGLGFGNFTPWKFFLVFGHCNNLNSINELQISPSPAIHLKQDRLNVCIIGQSVTWWGVPDVFFC